MRERSGNRHGRFRLLAAVLALLLLSRGAAHADRPTFSIDNSVEREEEFFPGGSFTNDTFIQSYSLDWGEQYSSRLAVDLAFEVELEDIIRSQDVDNKTVVPVLELTFTHPLLELGLLAQDTIEYSNEFNSPRSDELEFGIDLSITPLYKLPAIDTSLQRVIDQQENLVDTEENKFEISTGYEFGEAFSVEASWKEEDSDDRIFDNNDIDSHSWEFGLEYSQTYTPTLKVDLTTDWSGGREDTLNNAGQIVQTEFEKEVENKLKFTLETFPSVKSDLEFVIKDDLIEDADDDTIDWSVELSQEVMTLGTLTENLTYNRSKLVDPVQNTRTSELGLELELAGTPYKYLDYSITLNLSGSDVDDLRVPSNSTDTTETTFDVSVTAIPNPDVTVDGSFSWEKATEDGQDAGSSRNLKIEALFEGELLNIPNLLFEPSVEITTENDISGSQTTNTQTIELDFTYTWVLPASLSWEVSPQYTWKRDDSGVIRSLDYDDEMSVEISLSTWEFTLEKSSSFGVDLSEDEPLVWEHQWRASADRELTPNIIFGAEYEYEFDGEGNNTDKMESNLEWAYRDTTFSITFINDRTLDGPTNVVRTYEAEFQIEF